MRALHLSLAVTFVILASPALSLGQDAAAAVAPQDAQLDPEACERWKADAIALAETELEKVSDEYKEAMKSRKKEAMKTLLAKKKQLSKAMETLKNKTPEECWQALTQERQEREQKERQIEQEKNAREAAENAEKARVEAAAKKAAAHREFIVRMREHAKRGRNVLTRDEFKELVRKGMTPSQVIGLVGSPDKTQESGDLETFIYYKKTVDDITGNEDRSTIVNFWKGEVRSVTCQ